MWGLLLGLDERETTKMGLSYPSLSEVQKRGKVVVSSYQMLA